jgi:hypothetical protein
MAEELAIEPAVVAVAQMPLQFQLGWDTVRTWATGAQVFVNPDHAMIVFREQVQAQPLGEATPEVLMKNVASVVMPLSTARELRNILSTVLDATENGKN